MLPKGFSPRFRAVIAAALTLSAIGPIPTPAHAALFDIPGARPRKNTAPQNPAALDKLADEIAARRGRVEEFRFIAEQARKLGIRVWLFGGTAAGYGHYVRWDQLREGGDIRYQPDRFDYDYSNIFRSTQDLDIVTDGDAKVAKELETRLRDKFPHLQGGKKSAWEVRTLSQRIGDKDALLDDFNFLNQHSDSNSTGMIELTEPPAGETVVRDLRDWKNPRPAFLRDLQEGKLHFYFSDRHLETARAAQGLNPPILSVIRYLTKAFQYELRLRPEELARIRQIIAGFDPASIQTTSYVGDWIERNGKKLLQHAVNLEYAANTLHELGLTEKLIAIRGDAEAEGTLAWWLSRQPLASFPVGQGKGATAADLGVGTVSHETRNFLAYESITRAHTGEANILISRPGIKGENAKYGAGFYTRMGREGGIGTGLTIRFNVKPEARQGTDFDLVAGDDHYVVIHNRNALRVIPESLNWDLLGYFKYLASDAEIDKADRGLFEKLRRKALSRTAVASDWELHQVSEFLLAHARDQNFRGAMYRQWFAMPGSPPYSEKIIEALEARGLFTNKFAAETFELPHWQKNPLAPAFVRKQAALFALFESFPKGQELEKALELAKTDPSGVVELIPRLLKVIDLTRLPELLKLLPPEHAKPEFVLELIKEFRALNNRAVVPQSERNAFYLKSEKLINALLFNPANRYDLDDAIGQWTHHVCSVDCQLDMLDHLVALDDLHSDGRAMVAALKALSATRMAGDSAGGKKVLAKVVELSRKPAVQHWPVFWQGLSPYIGSATEEFGLPLLKNLVEDPGSRMPVGQTVKLAEEILKHARSLAGTTAAWKQDPTQVVARAIETRGPEWRVGLAGLIPDFSKEATGRLILRLDSDPELATQPEVLAGLIRSVRAKAGVGHEELASDLEERLASLRKNASGCAGEFGALKARSGARP